MKKGEKVFVNIVSNVIIIVIIITVLVFSFSDNIQNVFSSDLSPIYNGNQESDNVSLMINVYWGTEYLDSILATLSKYSVKCTFFVGGSWVAANATAFNKIVAAGHEIGNHGYFHKEHGKLSASANSDEIIVTHKVVEQLSGIKMNLFAPPSGDFSQTTLQVAEKLGYKTIMWTKDTIDWRDHDSNLIFSRATKNVKGGDLILMHPTRETAIALEKILQYYADNHLSVVTVSQNINTTN